jgi:hypothetical protein
MGVTSLLLQLPHIIGQMYPDDYKMMYSMIIYIYTHHICFLETFNLVPLVLPEKLVKILVGRGFKDWKLAWKQATPKRSLVNIWWKYSEPVLIIRFSFSLVFRHVNWPRPFREFSQVQGRVAGWPETETAGCEGETPRSVRWPAPWTPDLASWGVKQTQ